MFLLIENKGECPIEGFTILGVSTSRGNINTIGQFGSGNKHGINTMLRHNISPVIFSGTTQISFFTKPKRIKDTNYGLVCAKIGTTIHDLGFCVEFGELDWTEEWHGVREFVSNALDASESPCDVSIEVVSQTSARKGYTRIFLPLTPGIQKCYNELYDRFLHFDERINHTVLFKNRSSHVKIYKQGVFVKEGDDVSLFDYNFDEKFKIDESRNLDSTNCRSECGKLLSSSQDHLVHALKEIASSGQKYWEANFSYWDLCIKPWDMGQKQKWQNAWKIAYGDALITNNKLNELIGMLGRKKTDKKVVCLPENWYSTLEKYGVPTILSQLHEVEQKGYEIIPATNQVQQETTICWKIFCTLGLTFGKTKPKVKCFNHVVKNNETLHGFYKDNTIFVNKDTDEVRQTIFEEISHYLSDASDETRDFQEFVLKVVTRMSRELEK